MLTTLTIRDFVLIKNLTVSFVSGLGVLTGETGAGKSILLDALGLALGGRGEAGLVAQKASQTVISAEFAVESKHQTFSLAAGQGLSLDPDAGQIILRRTLGADGRSRAFVNDQPVTIGFLKILGDCLIEIHGQHDDRGLLNAKGHRALLDAFGCHEKLLAELAKKYAALSAARKTLAALEKDHRARRDEEEYDRHCLAELKAIHPKKGEEDALATARKLMVEGEKSGERVKEVLTLLEAGDGLDMTLRSALRRLEQLPEELKTLLGPAIEALARAAGDTEVGLTEIHRVSETLTFDQDKIDRTEERLFELRALARKHKCRPDDLPGVLAALEERISALEKGDGALKEAREQVAAAKTAFEAAAKKLTGARNEAAKKLDQGVAKELKPLKLDKAKFRTVLHPLPQDDWTAEGAEKVEFEVSTNPGAPFGPLIKIASGGELSRFILGLKVVLASAGSAPTLIFDEVDRGVGGAVADAVGERLARLSEDAQVLVVTHSPQVAARAGNHFLVGKTQTNGAAETTIRALDSKARHEEIARMLSGAKVTDKARAAAESLISGGA